VRYLLTGGAGFIGSHLAEQLVTLGDQVTVLDLNRPTYSVTGATYVQGDIMDEELLEPLIKTHDATFHLAAVVGFANVMREPTRTIQTSSMGTSEVLYFAHKYEKRVLFTSTSAVYGKTSNGGYPVREDDPCLFGPTSTRSWSYAYAKAADECLALAYHQEYQLPVIVARLFNTVGPRQSAEAGFVLPRFVDQAVRGDALTVHSPGSQTRTFCHVKDTARGLADLMECDKALGEIVNIGGCDTISMWDLAYRVIDLTESPSQVLLTDSGYGPGYDNVMDRTPNLTKARDLIRYRPQYGLDEMIHDAVAEYDLKEVA